MTDTLAHCPNSPHPENLHGVMNKDRQENYTTGQVDGTCAYCHQPVYAFSYTRDPWRAKAFIIEEEPV
jgi:hypothetical protein